MRRLGPVLALRRFRQARTRRAVAVRIGQPRRTGRDWLTPVDIRGLGRAETRYIYGAGARWAAALERKHRRRRRRAR